MSAKFWGVDIGATGVKAVGLTRTWQGFRVTDFRYAPFPSAGQGTGEGEKLRVLGEMFPAGSRGGEGLVLAVASQRLMLHGVALPFAERKKNLKVVKFEVEALLPYPVDQVVVDFYTPPERAEGERAMVFALRKEEVAQTLSRLEEIGLDPESLVPEPMALFWAVQQGRKEGPEGSCALLDLGEEKTTIIAWQQGRLTLARSIPIAGAALSKALGRAFKAPLPEEKNWAEPSIMPEEELRAALAPLAREIERTLAAYEPGNPAVEKIFLTGGGAAIPGVAQALGALLRRPVGLLDLGETSPSLLKEVPRALHPLLTVALGAAFWAMTPERMNFRQEEFASSKKARQAKTRVTLLASYGAALVLLGITGFAADLYLQEKRYRDLKAEIRREFTQAQPGVKKVVNEIQQMKNIVQDEKARVDALGGSSAPSSLDVLRDLSAHIEPAWKMRITDLVIDPEAVEVSGETDSFETVNRLKAKLDRSYPDVQVKTARASSLENVIEFKLQMKRSSG